MIKSNYYTTGTRIIIISQRHKNMAAVFTFMQGFFRNML